MIAEVAAGPAAIEALLAEADPVPRALEAAGAGADQTLDPLLAAGLAAARSPALRIWTEGIEPAVRVLGGRPGAVLLVEESAWRHTLVGLRFDEVALALVATVDLCPHPVPDERPVRLEAPAMADLIGRGQVHGHGLAQADADALHRRLEAGVRHWSVGCARPDGGGAHLRRNVEVVEGEGGIWRVHPLDEGLVELAPTSSTAVLRDLIALLGEARPRAGSSSGDRARS